MTLMVERTEEQRIELEKRYHDKKESELRNDIRKFTEDICKSKNATEIMLKCNSIRHSQEELLRRGLLVYC